MKPLLLLLCLYFSFNLYSQNHQDIGSAIINKEKFYNYLDLVREIYQNDHSFEMSKNDIFSFLRFNYKPEFPYEKYDGFKFRIFDNSQNYFDNNDNGTSISIIESVSPIQIFDIKGKKFDFNYGIGQQYYRVIANKRTQDVLSVSFFFELYKDVFNQDKSEKLKEEVESLINDYFYQKCAFTEHKGDYYNAKKIVWTFDDISQFHTIGKKYLKGWEDCVVSAEDEDIYYEISVGLCNNLNEMTKDYYSNVLYVEIKDYFQFQASQYVNDALREANYKRYSEKKGESIDIRKVNTYDLNAMIDYFLLDCEMGFGLKIPKQEIDVIFELLPENLIAASYAFNNKTKIDIKVDPEKWSKSSIEKRWYVLYHELGHDVLNFEHGEGGKMMFNFADKEYTWDEFILDRDYMMKAYRDRQ